MIEGLGQAKPVRLDGARSGTVARTAAPAAPRDVATAEQAASASPAATLAAEGAPVDTAKVDRIRAAIADGSYAVDPQAIAAKMIEQDLS